MYELFIKNSKIRNKNGELIGIHITCFLDLDFICTLVIKLHNIYLLYCEEHHIAQLQWILVLFSSNLRRNSLFKRVPILSFVKAEAILLMTEYASTFSHEDSKITISQILSVLRHLPDTNWAELFWIHTYTNLAPNGYKLIFGRPLN